MWHLRSTCAVTAKPARRHAATEFGLVVSPITVANLSERASESAEVTSTSRSEPRMAMSKTGDGVAADEAEEVEDEAECVLCSACKCSTDASGRVLIDDRPDSEIIHKCQGRINRRYHTFS